MLSDMTLTDLLDFLDEYAKSVEFANKHVKLESLEKRWRRVMAARGEIQNEITHRRRDTAVQGQQDPGAGQVSGL